MHVTTKNPKVKTHPAPFALHTLSLPWQPDTLPIYYVPTHFETHSPMNWITATLVPSDNQLPISNLPTKLQHKTPGDSTPEHPTPSQPILSTHPPTKKMSGGWAFHRFWLDQLMLRRSCIKIFLSLCLSYLMSVSDNASFYTYSSSPGKGLGFLSLSLNLSTWIVV